MTEFGQYQDAYETISLSRTDSGILEMRLHHEGGPYRWDARAGSDRPHREMNEALLNISRDRGNVVVILTGTGEEFSGPPANLGTSSKGDARHWERLQMEGAHLVMDLLNIPAPIISCLNGPAYRHAEIPLLADIVLAADDALVQDSAHFTNRMVPGDGIAILLPFLMGWNRGRYFHLTGQILRAAELKEYGLVNEVMPREQLLPRARELADQLVQNNPVVLRHTRALINAPLKALARDYLDYGLALEALGAVDETVQRTAASS